MINHWVNLPPESSFLVFCCVCHSILVLHQIWSQRKYNFSVPSIRECIRAGTNQVKDHVSCVISNVVILILYFWISFLKASCLIKKGGGTHMTIWMFFFRVVFLAHELFKSATKYLHTVFVLVEEVFWYWRQGFLQITGDLLSALISPSRVNLWCVFVWYWCLG